MKDELTAEGLDTVFEPDQSRPCAEARAADAIIANPDIESVPAR